MQETKKSCLSEKKRPWKTNLWQFDFYSTCCNKTSGSKKQIQLQLFPGSLHLVRFITSNWFETFIILTAGENKLGLVSNILQFNKTFFLYFVQGSSQAVFIMESIMEHVAKTLNKTPEEVRELNLYKNEQVSFNFLHYKLNFLNLCWVVHFYFQFSHLGLYSHKLLK